MDAQPGADLKPQLDAADIELRMLIEAVYLQYNYDFRDYTGASQKRRVLHAMREMNCANVSSLQARVMHDPLAFAQLLGYLTRCSATPGFTPRCANRSRLSSGRTRR
jgi:hypothetical protein